MLNKLFNLFILKVFLKSLMNISNKNSFYICCVAVKEKTKKVFSKKSKHKKYNVIQNLVNLGFKHDKFCVGFFTSAFIVWKYLNQYIYLVKTDRKKKKCIRSVYKINKYFSIYNYKIIALHNEMFNLYYFKKFFIKFNENF